MRVYTYRARNMSGRIVEGTLQADNSHHAHKRLEDDGLIPVEIRLAAGPEAARGRGLFRARVKDEELIMFTRQLGTLLKAGVPILQALDVLRRQTDSPRLKQALAEAVLNIEGGTRLSQALAEFPDIFSPQYVNIIVSGESGGDMVQSLSSIADWLEREMEFKNEIKAALRYPAIVIVALVVAALIMVGFVIPRLAAFLRQGNVALPLPTRMLVGGSDFIQHNAVLITGCLVGLGALIFLVLKIPSVRLAVDRAKFTLPLMGPLYTRIAISRFSHVFSLLVRNGVTVMRALEILPGVIPNTFLKACIQNVRKSIQDGSSIAEGFSHIPVFPPLVISLVSIGEKTGSLDAMLDHVVAQNNTEIRFKLKNLTSQIEPLITLVLGVGVLFLALAILLPMWNMAQAIKR